MAGPEVTRIEDHGIIGNLETVALVSTQGAIDFACFPQFDSPTVFAALLDPKKGGIFSLAPVASCLRIKQIYLPETNVLLTRFFTAEGVSEVLDFMPLARAGDVQHFCIVRSVRAVRGEVRMALRCAPRFDYARARHTLKIEGEQAIFKPDDGSAALRLDAPAKLQRSGDDAVCEFVIRPGQTLIAAIEAADAPAVKRDEDAADRGLDRTVAYWRNWSDRSTYNGRWREPVMRSALTLKLLMSKQHGSLVAAATFGLPEQLGGGLNWDYRYCWIRDASLTVYAFLRLGYVEEATAFIDWIQARCNCCRADGSLQLMYAIDGRTELDEFELDHLSGYAGSWPALIGNAASEQLQLDIYGPLMDAVYLANKWGAPTHIDSWAGLVRVVNYVCKHWSKPDAGIWEVRGPKRHYLHSRLMCWVAVDRACRLAAKRSLPAPLIRWTEVRDKIYQDIVENFWDEERKAFVQARGKKTLDASVLMMPLVRFIAPNDPRWLSTLDAVKQELLEEPDVFRYRTDGESGEPFEGTEGAFVTCSFWYVEALCLADRLDEARLIFERLITNANHLGLYSEERGEHGEQLGNFPQALTHLSLISAAFSLDRKLARKAPEPWS